MASKIKPPVAGPVSADQLRRWWEERIATGRRPRRSQVPNELGDLFARRAEEAAASWATLERSRRDDMLRYLRDSGHDEIADEFEDAWRELQMYRRAVDVRNARADLTRINRARSLEKHNANRPPSQTAASVKAEYRRHLRMGSSVDEARRRVRDNHCGDFSKRHINRLLAETASESPPDAK